MIGFQMNHENVKSEKGRDSQTRDGVVRDVLGVIIRVGSNNRDILIFVSGMLVYKALNRS